jgi:hypothetical protein
MDYYETSILFVSFTLVRMKEKIVLFLHHSCLLALDNIIEWDKQNDHFAWYPMLQWNNVRTHREIVTDASLVHGPQEVLFRNGDYVTVSRWSNQLQVHILRSG